MKKKLITPIRYTKDNVVISINNTKIIPKLAFDELSQIIKPFKEDTLVQ
jgi:hypothetical protein